MNTASIRHCSSFSARVLSRGTLLGVALALTMGITSTQVNGDIVITKVGTPGYDVVDSHLYTAPTQGYFQALFPNHFPRVPHPGPYDQEFTEGLAATGYQEKQVFSVEDFTDPNAVHLGWILVPNANALTGSSFDFASGPIIPLATQPFRVRGDVFLNGAPFELGAFAFDAGTNDGFEGVSHFIIDVWENSAFAPPGLTDFVGDYEYRLTLRDTSNNGYDLLGRFSIAAVPEPGSLLTVGLVGAVIAARRWNARRKR